MADDSLFVKEEDGVLVVVVLVYVDDMAVASPKLGKIVQFKESLRKRFEIKDMGELEYILGIQVTRDRAARTIRINQTAYIREVLKRYGMADCAAVSTPLVSQERHGSPVPKVGS
jgi:hypothetical protein